MSDSRPADTPVWCLVGNVRAETSHGPGGSEKRAGTSLFSPGAKVYCLPPQWGDGYENIKVVGHHRRTKKYVTVVTPSRHIVNWRVKLVYSPEVIRRLCEHGYPWGSKEELEQVALAVMERAAEKYGDPQPPKARWWEFWKLFKQ